MYTLYKEVWRSPDRITSSYMSLKGIKMQYKVGEWVQASIPDSFIFLWNWEFMDSLTLHGDLRLVKEVSYWNMFKAEATDNLTVVDVFGNRWKDKNYIYLPTDNVPYGVLKTFWETLAKYEDKDEFWANHFNENFMYFKFDQPIYSFGACPSMIVYCAQHMRFSQQVKLLHRMVLDE